MNRYLLDTNIITFLFTDTSQISRDVEMILKDFSNQKFVSSVTLVELLQLYRIGKIKTQHKKASDMVRSIERDLYVDILPFTQEHSFTMAKLEVTEGHNDPFDHAILSHAITDRLILISSDRKFDSYTPQKLKFIYNKR